MRGIDAGADGKLCHWRSQRLREARPGTTCAPSSKPPGRRRQRPPPSALDPAGVREIADNPHAISKGHH
jgi:hypothetical protein